MTELRKILYVEDEADIQTIARLALQDVGGFELQICSNGNEALATAEHYTPDLLILDVMLPGMDGPTTLAELRKIPALAGTPALFMTAKVQPQELEQLRAQGAIEVITKPFDPMTLAETVRQIWQQA
ncbi:MAG: response regulator [Thiohalophilus sp.]|uniref:response regulator n=1 Tax=Thiohalophilus sp. TaxID=3028392 RepID=UPI0028703884|nr:response regulator [Thiohalophilus sp.]MDR9436397.1 response regulator [Thiohalophilus sp.]